VIELITRSHGIHESALHELCQRQGIYRQAGIEVTLVDGTGPAWRSASRSESAATVAVGGVVADWLRGDSAWNVHFVATAKPMMWLVGRPTPAAIRGLAGRRIAIPDRNHMPSLFLRLVLERYGLDMESDVELVEVRDRPDRLRLLEAAEVDASLLGPEGLGRPGDHFHPLVYIGDHIEFPTVGFAARPGLDAQLAAAMTAAMADGLERLRTDEEAAIDAMQAVEPDVPAAVARHVLADFVRPDWTGPAWTASGSVGDVPALARMLGLDVPPDDELRAFLQGRNPADEQCTTERS
jgi:ABC-type nitrate/sulfonate/bicarbonate transport system substrate-binding protein